MIHESGSISTKFLKAERGWNKELISEECIVSRKVDLLRGTEGSYQEGHLTSADQLRLHSWESLKLQLG